jgi:hypothetical protein
MFLLIVTSCNNTTVEIISETSIQTEDSKDPIVSTDITNYSQTDEIIEESQNTTQQVMKNEEKSYLVEIVDQSVIVTLISDPFYDIDELLNLGDIEELRILPRGEKFTVYDIDKLTVYKELKSLTLSNMIPIDSKGNTGLRFISQFKNLEYLDIDNIEINDWSFLSELSKLSTFGVGTVKNRYDKPLSIDIDENIESITTLNIWVHNAPVDMSFVEKIPNIKSVLITESSDGGMLNSILNFDSFSALSELEDLTINGVNIDSRNVDEFIEYFDNYDYKNFQFYYGSINALAECKKIKNISFDYFGFDGDIEWISNLNNLETIYIHGSSIISLEHLIKQNTVNSIVITDTSIEETFDIKSFAELSGLEILGFMCPDDWVSNDDIDYLKSKLKNCKIDLYFY